MTESPNRSDHPKSDAVGRFAPRLPDELVADGGSRAAAGGDEAWTSDAFAECFRVYAEGVRAALRVRLKNQADVEDCLSRVFERLWSRGAAVAPPARRSWLLVVARNEAAACVRREARHSFRCAPPVTAGQQAGQDRCGVDERGGDVSGSSTEVGGGRDRVWEELVDDGPLPWQGLLQGEEFERLRDAARLLSAEQSEVIRYRFFEGLAFQEIADRVGIPLGTALSRARAAILRLKRELDR